MSYETLVWLHAGGGGIALFAGGVAATARKGGPAHVLGGRIFAFAMAFTAASAVVLAILEPNAFLLGIGLFTAYLLTSGWAWIRPAPHDVRLRRVRFAAVGGLAAAAYLVATAVEANLDVVLLVFAGVTLLLSLADLLRPADPDAYAARHAGRMGGAYIAAATAFLVVNLDDAPRLLVWLGPTIVGTPLITRAVRRFRARDPQDDPGIAQAS